MSDRAMLSDPLSVSPVEDRDPNQGPPVPSSACLYGLIGDIARAGSENSEANPFAIGLHALIFIGCVLGRCLHLKIGDTQHYPVLFGLHVGRSGRGRKGDALSLVRKLHKEILVKASSAAPGIHSGGLSTREGLIFLIHDGYFEGKTEVSPILDKRLWIIEPEFANILQQTRREGNTLSPALRELFDSNGLKPATKGNRLGVDAPHCALSAGITPSELTAGIPLRELLNGFANRIVMIHAERIQVIPFPQAVQQDVVEYLAERIIEVIDFAHNKMGGDGCSVQMSISSTAVDVYRSLYLGELSPQFEDDKVMTLLERRAPVLLRMAMIFASTDMTTEIQERHIHAATAWTRYWSDSVKYIFSSTKDDSCSDEISDLAEKIVKFLSNRVDASRTEITVGCFGGHVVKPKLDKALGLLMTCAPPRVVLNVVPRANGPGSPTKRYRLAAIHAKSANAVPPQDVSANAMHLITRI